MLAPLALAATLLLAPPAPEPPKAPADAFRPDPAWKSLGPSLWFDPQGEAAGPPRPGRAPRGAARAPALPQGDQGARGDPRDRRLPCQIHAGLLLRRRRAGPPRPLPPQVRAPGRLADRHRAGVARGGKTHRADAREWVKDERGKPRLDKDWVFAGSELIDDPADQEDDLRRRRRRPDHRGQLLQRDPRPPVRQHRQRRRPRFRRQHRPDPPRGTGVTMFLRPRPSRRRRPALPHRGVAAASRSSDV